MRNIKSLTTAVAIALGMVSAAAFAASPTGTIRADMQTTTVQPEYFVLNQGTARAQKVYYFNQIDTSHNGQLRRSEIPLDMRALRRDFTRADWDKNGQISPEEYWEYANHSAPQNTGTDNSMIVVFR